MKLKSLLLAAALLCGLSTAVNAQNIIGTNSFLATVGNWVADADIDTISVSTNNGVAVYTTNAVNWLNTSFEVGVDVKQNNLASIANEIRAQYDFSDGLNLGVDGEFYGLGTPFNSIEGQFGYAVVNYYSLKVDADLLAGYDNLTGAGEFGGKLLAEKKMTEVTFIDTAISVTGETKGKFSGTPGLQAGAGFCIDRTSAQQGAGLLGLHKKVLNIIPL